MDDFSRVILRIGFAHASLYCVCSSLRLWLRGFGQIIFRVPDCHVGLSEKYWLKLVKTG